jgi:hypothetical protein
MRSVRKTSAGTHQIAVTADARHIAAALTLVIEVHKAAVGRPLPRANDGGIELTRITRITITEVLDYHGE